MCAIDIVYNLKVIEKKRGYLVQISLDNNNIVIFYEPSQANALFNCIYGKFFGNANEKLWIFYFSVLFSLRIIFARAHMALVYLHTEAWIHGATFYACDLNVSESISNDVIVPLNKFIFMRNLFGTYPHLRLRNIHIQTSTKRSILGCSLFPYKLTCTHERKKIFCHIINEFESIDAHLIAPIFTDHLLQLNTFNIAD